MMMMTDLLIRNALQDLTGSTETESAHTERQATQ